MYLHKPEVPVVPEVVGKTSEYLGGGEGGLGTVSPAQSKERPLLSEREGVA